MVNIFKVFVFSLFFVAKLSCAATSPEAFAEDLITSLEKNDIELFESLILPESLKISRGDDPVKHNRKIANIFKQKKPTEFDSYNVTITDIQEDKDYDSTNNSLYLFGNKRAIFPVKLEKRLTIFVKTGSADQDGEWTTPHMTQVLSQYKGKWYMVWPDAIK